MLFSLKVPKVSTVLILFKSPKFSLLWNLKKKKKLFAVRSQRIKNKVKPFQYSGPESAFPFHNGGMGTLKRGTGPRQDQNSAEQALSWSSVFRIWACSFLWWDHSLAYTARVQWPYRFQSHDLSLGLAPLVAYCFPGQLLHSLGTSSFLESPL